MNKKWLIVIAGPTAVGKTALAIELGLHFQAEIFSADSRQFYKNMDIGTAKPSANELSKVKHHYINSHEVEDYFSVGDFAEKIQADLKNYFINKDVAILVGGSGLYIEAVLNGIDDMPKVDLNFRKSLMDKLETSGLAWFTEQLENLDPETYRKIDLKNTQRVFRAVEVSLQSGKAYSSFLNKTTDPLAYGVIKVGLDMPRAELYNRINRRVDQMVIDGLEQECRSMIKFKGFNACKTVGYVEFFAYFDEDILKDEAIEKIKQNTRRYAKRQLTWFRNRDVYTWFSPNQLPDIKQFIETVIF